MVRGMGLCMNPHVTTTLAGDRWGIVRTAGGRRPAPPASPRLLPHRDEDRAERGARVERGEEVEQQGELREEGLHAAVQRPPGAANSVIPKAARGGRARSGRA